MVVRHVGVSEQSKGDEVDALDDAAIAALHDLEFAWVTRRKGGKDLIQPRRKVGSVRIGDLQVTVHPKLPVRRLLFLLGYADDPQWRDDDIECAEDEEVIPAVVDAFARQLARAFPTGVPQAYSRVEEASTVLRGRVRPGAQASRQLGLVSPLEVEYDDYGVDTPGNRVLATAIRAARRVPGLRPAVDAELTRAASMLGRVRPLAPRDAVPSWTASEPPSAYDAAVRLALLLLSGRSIDLPSAERHGPLPAAAFTVNMWGLFEQFVGKALAAAAPPRLRYPARNKWRRFDADGLLEARPDVLWLSGGKPVAVVDAKYKIEASSGYPNQDVYQVLAYCLSLGLRRGHLVYAKGNAPLACYRVGGITVEAHALDLDTQPSVLRDQVAAIAARIFGDAET